MNSNKKRKALIIGGQVQGVGFRPFIWKIANHLGLTGFVRNTSAGVLLEIQGNSETLAEFEKNLTQNLPPLAKITTIEHKDLMPITKEKGFEILHSEGHRGQNILVSPDVGVCQECLEDSRNPRDRRFGYAFTNCTNCGPRFSITKGLPYDRPLTSMACFELCPKCAAEYANPENRRFHAQPIACPDCGPKLWFVNKNEQSLPNCENIRDPLKKAANLLLMGGILAIKGLGGFQLACDARNAKAVNALRERKQRPHKALAVMARDISEISLFCSLSKDHENLLLSAEKPIVLCPSRPAPAAPLAENIAPDSTNIGVMLPSTPLHALLLDTLFEQSKKNSVLVMTSANPVGDPICLGNREALNTLASFADAFLFNDRDILVRVDDSVVTVDSIGHTSFLRRARGYAPAPIPVQDNVSGILGTGAELKCTFCLTRENLAFPGQHIGDLKSPATFQFYQDALIHLENLLEVQPKAIVHDLHPDFISTNFAKELSGKLQIPAAGLQHHAAHAAAALAENNTYEPALALCLDGSGFGTDGSIWGGELLLMELYSARWRRIASFSPFPLPGGEMAIREPWRIACALGKEHTLLPWPKERQRIIQEIIKKGLNSPLTSSCGRLFDAISACLGICDTVTYEGQAAIKLERDATLWQHAHEDGWPQTLFGSATKNIDFTNLLNPKQWVVQCLEALEAGVSKEEIAAAFHYDLAKTLAENTAYHARKIGIDKVALSGGVLHNALIAKLLPEFLIKAGLKPLIHKYLPPGDACIAFGQAVWGQRLAACCKLTI